MSLPTASSLERVLLCPPSWVLDSTNRDNEAADKGTFIHKYLELLVSQGKESARAWAVAANAKNDFEVAGFCESLEVEFYD